MLFMRENMCVGSERTQKKKFYDRLWKKAVALIYTSPLEIQRPNKAQFVSFIREN